MDIGECRVSEEDYKPPIRPQHHNSATDLDDATNTESGIVSSSTCIN
jgi:hypothetical protein